MLVGSDDIDHSVVTVGVFINTIPLRSPLPHQLFTIAGGLTVVRKVWHDGLRTRTDRPRFRR